MSSGKIIVRVPTKVPVKVVARPPPEEIELAEESTKVNGATKVTKVTKVTVKPRLSGEHIHRTLNTYIAAHGLQSGYYVTLDDRLQELLGATIQSPLAIPTLHQLALQWPTDALKRLIIT